MQRTVFDPLDPFSLVHRPAIGTFYTFGLRTKSSLSVLVVANMRCNIRYIKRIVNFVGFSTKIFHSAAGDTQLIHLFRNCNSSCDLIMRLINHKPGTVPWVQI